MGGEDHFFRVLASMLSVWSVGAALNSLLNKKVRWPQYSMLELVLTLVAYGAVMALLHPVLAVRHLADTTRAFIMGAEALLLPLGILTGSKNREAIHERFKTLRLAAVLMGPLSLMCALPALCTSFALAQTDSPYRNNPVLLVSWVGFLLPLLGQFWFWLTRRASLDEQTEQTEPRD